MPEPEPDPVLDTAKIKEAMQKLADARTRSSILVEKLDRAEEKLLLAEARHRSADAELRKGKEELAKLS